MIEPTPIPAHLIPELPTEVRPFTERELTRNRSWTSVGQFNFFELIPDEIGFRSAIDRIIAFGDKLSAESPIGVSLIVRQIGEGYYKDYENTYQIGYWLDESDDQVRDRLEESKRRKIAARDRRKKKWADEEADRARIRAIKEETAQAELNLVRTLAAKFGLTLIEPDSSR